MTQLSLYQFSLSQTNLKLYNSSVTPKVVEKVITNLDLSKVSGPDCIPVVALKNWWPVSLLPVVSKVYGKLVNKGIIDYLPDLLHGLQSYGTSGQIFGFVSSFLSNR